MVITIAAHSPLRVLRYYGKFSRIERTGDFPVVTVAERKIVSISPNPVYVAYISGNEYMVRDSDVISVEDFPDRRFRSRR